MVLRKSQNTINQGILQHFLSSTQNCGGPKLFSLGLSLVVTIKQATVQLHLVMVSLSFVVLCLITLPMKVRAAMLQVLHKNTQGLSFSMQEKFLLRLTLMLRLCYPLMRRMSLLWIRDLSVVCHHSLVKVSLSGMVVSQKVYQQVQTLLILLKSTLLVVVVTCLEMKLQIFHLLPLVTWDVENLSLMMDESSSCT